MKSAMADAIRPHVPKLDAKYLADEMTTVDRQRGHVEVLLEAVVEIDVTPIGTYVEIEADPDRIETIARQIGRTP